MSHHAVKLTFWERRQTIRAKRDCEYLTYKLAYLIVIPRPKNPDMLDVALKRFELGMMQETLGRPTGTVHSVQAQPDEEWAFTADGTANLHIMRQPRDPALHRICRREKALVITF